MTLMIHVQSRSAHPSMRLNYDILLVVMSLLRRKKDILRLACACRALYQAVIPYLLKGHVELKSQAHIVSFCHFMLRDRSRFRYLRSLSFGDGNDDDLNEILDEETERLVPTMFKHASNLEVLLLDCDRFVSTESFCRAIAELPSLSTFIVYLEDYECYRMFRGIKAPVKSVHIIPRDNSPPPDEQPDAIYVVEPMKDSLEILHVTHFDAVFSMDTQYPKLVELYINGGLLTEIRPLIHSFPNLRRLRIFLEESNMPWVHEDASLRQIIQHNILAQTHERWKTLSQVSSDTHALRMFRIHSKVDYLNIEGDELTGEDLDDLFDVLSETRPRRLTFRCHEFPRNIQRLDHVLSPVSDMLEALRLDFVVKGREAKEPGPIIVRRQYLFSTEDVAETLTLRKYCRNLFLDCPSASYAWVWIGYHKRSTSTVRNWRHLLTRSSHS